MNQVKDSFDDETKRKIKKSFLLYGLPTAVIAGITSYLKSGNVLESVLVGVCGLAGSVINAGSEYSKGEEPKQ
jgi:hypothetical protein